MSEEWNKNSDAGEDIQMPLTTGGGDAPAEEYSGPSRPKINTSTLALAAAFAAAIAVLYLLGLQNKPRPAAADVQQRMDEATKRIESILSDKDKQADVQKLFNNTPKLIKAITDYWDQFKGQSLDLPGNPFEPENIRRVDPVTQIVDDSDGAEFRKAAEEFAGLKLTMVVNSSNPSALIGDKIVSVGNNVTDHLTVTKIASDYVVLNFKDRSFKLALNKPH